MKRVIIYDQYSSVFSEDGLTLLHPSSGTTYLVGEYNSVEEANAVVQSKYNESKQEGEYTDKKVDIAKGYAELKINFTDGRVLNRVIYVD